MAKVVSTPIPSRTLDVAMFQTPVGLPSSAFKQELETQLLEVSQFMTGQVSDHSSGNRIRIAHWNEDKFKVTVR